MIHFTVNAITYSLVSALYACFFYLIKNLTNTLLPFISFIFVRMVEVT